MRKYMEKYFSPVSSRCGTTMVEVIVAFGVLVMILAMFSQSLMMAGRIFQRSDRLLQDYRELAGDYYLENTRDMSVEQTENQALTFTSRKSGTSFTIHASLREFKNETGSIYDVIPEETKGGTGE